MTAARDLAASVYAAEQDIDRLTRPLGPAIAASVRRHAVDGRILTTASVVKIDRDIDRALSTMYPATRGAPSRLERLIVRRSREAQRKPITAAVAELRSRLEPDLLQAMGDGR